jgi:hypothetical protein
MLFMNVEMGEVFLVLFFVSAKKWSLFFFFF